MACFGVLEFTDWNLLGLGVGGGMGGKAGKRCLGYFSLFSPRGDHTQHTSHSHTKNTHTDTDTDTGMQRKWIRGYEDTYTYYTTGVYIYLYTGTGKGSWAAAAAAAAIAASSGAYNITYSLIGRP